jgi:hypothetical protein
MSDEVPVDAEGGVIEKAFIAYFDSSLQQEERAHERATLYKNLKRMKKHKQIDHAVFDFEMSEPNSYFRFYSDAIEPSHRHVFSFSAAADGLSLEKLNSDFDAVQHFAQHFGSS